MWRNFNRMLTDAMAVLYVVVGLECVLRYVCCSSRDGVNVLSRDTMCQACGNVRSGGIRLGFQLTYVPMPERRLIASFTQRDGYTL